jgi:glyoxylase-like metal-dependent hydrolase (beta-lactamase superfamily II)
MQTKVFILVEGYVRDNGQSVQSTVTLIQDGEINIVVDPGMTDDPYAISKALKKHNLTPDDISFVAITHHHPDHTRHMGLFPKAALIDFWAKYENDKWYDLPKNGYQISPNVQTIPTPGHTKEDITILVKNVANIEKDKTVTVAICHLWWYEGRDDDRNAEDFNQLLESRKKILQIADYIIPGHGNYFKT